MTASKTTKRSLVLFTFLIIASFQLVLSEDPNDPHQHHHHPSHSSINPVEDDPTSHSTQQTSGGTTHNYDHDHDHSTLADPAKDDNHHDHTSGNSNDHDNSSHEMINDGHVMTMHDETSPNNDRLKDKMKNDNHDPQHGDMNDMGMHMHMKDDMGDMGMHMHMKNDSGMHMINFFHAGVDEIVLFQQWKITTVGELIASMAGIMLLGMLYEGLKYFREYLFKRFMSSLQFSTVAVTGECGGISQLHKVQKQRILSFEHAAQTCLHLLQIIMSYFLMLIFMTFNVWLCLSVVLGSGIGYFIFGWKKATIVDITEHCH